MLLVDGGGRILLAVGMYCYALELADHKLLVWHASKSTPGSPRTEERVEFRVLDVDRLRPFSDADHAHAGLTAASGRFASMNGPLAGMELWSSLGAGTHAVEFPAEMLAIDELGVLAAPEASADSDPALHVWILRPRAGTVEVLPQSWFNARDWDLGYQWVTRIGREPATRRWVGDGIRIGTFVLDASGTGVEKWLEWKV